MADTPSTEAGRYMLQGLSQHIRESRLWDHDAALEDFRQRILAIEAEAAAPAEGLRPFMREHRLCGPVYDGCYSHWPMPHCRADGMAWPCDVDGIRAALAGVTSEGEPKVACRCGGYRPECGHGPA